MKQKSQAKPKPLKIPPPPGGVKRAKKGGKNSKKIYKRCPCGKSGTFRTYDSAMGAAHRVIPTDIKRVYYCAEGGGYHFTGSPKMSKKQRIDELKMTKDEESVHDS